MYLNAWGIIFVLLKLHQQITCLCQSIFLSWGIDDGSKRIPQAGKYSFYSFIPKSHRIIPFNHRLESYNIKGTTPCLAFSHTWTQLTPFVQPCHITINKHMLSHWLRNVVLKKKTKFQRYWTCNSFAPLGEDSSPQGFRWISVSRIPHEWNLGLHF